MMGIQERKDRQRMEKRREILHSAMALFLEKGFEKVTIRNIAERIEFSAATIYLYFKDKNEILDALHDEGFEKLWAMQTTLDTIRDPFEKLRKQAEVYLTFAFNNREYYDLMFIQRAPVARILEHVEWEAGVKTYEFLEDNVRACMADGSLGTGDINAAAFGFWAFVHGIASLVIRGRLSMMQDQQIADLALGAVSYLMENMHGNADREAPGVDRNRIEV